MNAFDVLGIICIIVISFGYGSMAALVIDSKVGCNRPWYKAFIVGIIWPLVMLVCWLLDIES